MATDLKKLLAERQKAADALKALDDQIALGRQTELHNLRMRHLKEYEEHGSSIDEIWAEEIKAWKEGAVADALARPRTTPAGKTPRKPRSAGTKLASANLEPRLPKAIKTDAQGNVEDVYYGGLPKAWLCKTGEKSADPALLAKYKPTAAQLKPFQDKIDAWKKANP